MAGKDQNSGGRTSRYEQLGASATKAGMHAALERAGITLEQDLFISLVPDFTGDASYFGFAHCDGAGTKAIVPYLIFRATGDRSKFAGLAQDALVMNLDDVFCAGVPEGMILANTIGRNAAVIDDQCIEQIVKGYRECIATLAAHGVPITLSGGETADCGDTVRTLIVDATLVGRIRAAGLIRTSRIAPGDRIIQLSSAGRTSYETKENSGIGSNGLTLARHVLLSAESVGGYPEVWNSEIDRALCYRGPYSVLDSPPGLGMTVGEALCSPTRSYAPLLATLIPALGADLHGIIHLTGGAHSKVLRFVRGVRLVKEDLLPVPPLFSLIEQCGGVTAEELYRVFNMGARMELYVPSDRVPEVLEAARALRIEAKVAGEVQAHPDGADAQAEVVLTTPSGTISFRG